MDKKAVRIRICELLDICQTCEKPSVRGAEHTELRCGGCRVYKEFARLRKNIDRPAKKRFESILAKGQDMKKADIALLLENGIPKAMIKKALGMGSAIDFRVLLEAFGFATRRVKEDIGMTLEEFIQLHYVEKKKIAEIAEITGKSAQALYGFKNYNKEKIEKMLAEKGVTEAEMPTKKEPIPKKQEINWEQKYKKLADAFDNRTTIIEGLKQEIQTLRGQQPQEDTTCLNATCEDIEKELANVREENARLIDDYKQRITQILLENNQLEKENKLMSELLKVKL